MTGNDLYFLIQKLNSISEHMERIQNSDGFLNTKEYPIDGYTVAAIQAVCNKACKIINSTDFVPNHPHQ